MLMGSLALRDILWQVGRRPRSYIARVAESLTPGKSYQS